MADRIVRLRGGRAIGVQAAGDPIARRMVVFAHPAPGSCVFDPDPTATSSWGVHLVAIDRPGYGSSEPLPASMPPTITGRADDLAEYVAVLRAEAASAAIMIPKRIGVVGWSAGGRIALAFAARYPALVDRVAVVATPAPQSGVPWIPESLARMNARLAAMPIVDSRAELGAMLVRRTSPAEDDLAQVGASDTDAPALDRPGARDRLRRMLTEAYRQGVAGVADDILSYATDDWGFDLGSVRAKTLLVYGGADPVIGSAHGRWYRHRIKHAHLKVVLRAGHLVVIDAWADVLAHVAPHED